ncbi:MAG TPA: hypothetical protein VK563_17475, partial [Puia sp.]|nr:hypothetical protein [Puia sp.]
MHNPVFKGKHQQRQTLFATTLLVLLFSAAKAQYVEKVTFDAGDNTNGYYLAIPPASQHISGALVFLGSFRTPENLLPETRLHNVAANNDLLTIYASLGNKIFADTATASRIDAILKHVAEKYKVDTSFFVLGGYDIAGTIALRYTEMTYEHPSSFTLRPKAVFGVASDVDLSGLYRLSERQIKKNYFPPAVGDAHAFLDLMNKELGTPADHPENYRRLSPFAREQDAVAAGAAGGGKLGNERWLFSVPLRLYYDADINWQLNARGNSLYDTNIPDGSELINRLMLAGDKKAEFISAKQPGMRSNGNRNASSLSIVDETDCIQWIKRTLHIFDPNNPLSWMPPYKLIAPAGWTVEHAWFPPPFAPGVKLKGMEDIRFPPGWGDATSEEYWSVAYLLWLDAGQPIDAAVLQNNLTIYYNELTTGGAGRRGYEITADMAVPTQVTIRKSKAEPGDLETYTGTIHMFDYLGK